MGLLSQTQNQYYDSNNSSNYGDYQFVSLDSIINGFMVAYVGESKLISKVSRTDVQFHGMRAVQEFSYDIFRSVKSQEIEVPNTLKMVLPQDYVNYVKLTASGNDGVKRNLYPTGKTSNPFAITQDVEGNYTFSGNETGDYRQISIECNGDSDITDGDVVRLPFKDLELNINSELYFIFNDDNDVSDGYYPSDGLNVTRHFVDILGLTEASSIAEALSNSINTSKYFKASSSGSVVTITYLTIRSSYAAESTRNASSTILTDRLQISILNSGATSSNTYLTEQSESNTWGAYKSHVPIDNRGDDYESENFIVSNNGGRYGLDPQHAHDNGTFYIDYSNGFIHFGSALAGETIILDYISDGLGTDGEMVVHKFAEEAVYKWIAYGVISSRSNMPEYIVQRFKKERFAEARKAKIRLSNIKIEEFTQVLKGLSKPIK